ncbi:TetR/AcrR family transcriptional regulator [Frankia sp. CNm7]|uniref:TetR/AcrR family transcriptional regulator n=2 Tax=Frankia nepalensis TaxID=1836974 RepID=A0A937UMW7_9ACTN|nr:TetR/AcrR family transcriptional regulator [Frankia nepalensis]MBL7499231.1 TetR/AcrR family transcriptional regulator [Frankia nepalensis]MBL7512123.1 TetR/AcrR family transcriptional regulator [Frankia nepalensis]MBL7521028.1 TetR/AcrR family transcriptional regulator [Frankia nepalensis]MBL7627302.1 TetR/AcrR family transcriptional regulator [Frankia nepalensis]
MEAAFEVFARQGYAATSLDDIAAATPASRQTVYNHFGDKEQLFLAVIDAQISVSLDELRAATLAFPDRVDGADDAAKYLVDLAHRLVEVFMSPRTASLRLLVQTESPRHPGLLALWRSRVATPVWPTLIGNLARLAHAGALRIDDPARAAGQFVTLVSGTSWQMTELGTFAISPPPAPGSPELDTAIRSNVGLFVRAYAPDTSNDGT